jgi:NADPH-dependent curcumin reductase CurA
MSLNRAWIFEQRPVGNDFDSALKFRDWPMPEPADGQVLVKTLHLSVDPANRRWMAGPTYMPPTPTGGPMWGFVTGRGRNADDAASDCHASAERLSGGDMAGDCL